MAAKKKTSKAQSNLTLFITIAILIITLLGALGYIDTVALDDALEPFLGVRIFLTTREPVVVDDGSVGVGVNNPEVENTAQGDWWTVYFTQPGSENNFVANELIGLINGAQNTIHIASFEFDLPDVAQALEAAEGRGVEVQWVTDDEHGIEADEDDGLYLFEEMEDAGVEVKDDHRGALMHNKFWIFDGTTTWTGSTNITENGTLYNNNNVIVIQSAALSRVYEREFQEMWTADEFGPTSTSTVAQQDLVINGTAVSVRFGPEDDVADLLAALLSQAQSEIRFMAFSFTHEDMGNAILSRAQSGVDVAGIFEQRGSETEYSELSKLYCAGVPVMQDGNPRTFHHKVLIIDAHIVVTGSFNFSNNANESNDENVVIIDNAEIAAEYLKEFDRRWAEAQQPDAGDVTCP